jgi:hypothetical protein
MYYYYAIMQLNNGADAGAENRLPRDEIWNFIRDQRIDINAVWQHTSLILTGQLSAGSARYAPEQSAVEWSMKQLSVSPSAPALTRRAARRCFCDFQ